MVPIDGVCPDFIRRRLVPSPRPIAAQGTTAFKVDTSTVTDLLAILTVAPN